MATITQKQFIQALLAEVQYNRDKIQALEKTQVLVDVDLFYSKIGADARFQYKADMVDYDTKEEINSRFSNYYTQIQIDQKLDKLILGDFDLSNYYNKINIDNIISAITANYLSKIEAEALYQTTAEISIDYVNKTTTDLQDIKGGVASHKFINNSGNLPVGNSNELATTEYVDSKITAGGNFVKTNYFSNNSELLTRNDGVSSEVALIGAGYKGIQSYGDSSTGDIKIGTSAGGNINIGSFFNGNFLSIGELSTGDIKIGTSSTGNIEIGNRISKGIGIGRYSKSDISLGFSSTGNIEIGSIEWGIGLAPEAEGYLISGAFRIPFKKIGKKVNETLDSFVATGNTGAPLGTINDSTSQFFNGGTITSGNTVKLDFINSNYTFTENKKPGFSLVRNDTKKLDIGKLTESAIVKVGVKIKSFTGTSVGQLDIWLNSGNLDVGADSIVLLNPNPNKFYAKSIAVLNSSLVQEEGVSVNITSENGNFVIDALEVILMP